MLEVVDFICDYVLDWLFDLFDGGEQVVDAMATVESISIFDSQVISIIVNDIMETNTSIDKRTALLWAKKIVEQSIKYKINPFLISSQAKQESTWNPNAIGKDDDMGLLQIVGNTAYEIADKLGYKNFRPEMLKDPLLNIEFSAYYLHHCYERTAKYIGTDYQNRDWLAIASYNMGVIPAVKNYVSGKLDKTHYVQFVKRYFLETYDGLDVQF